MLRLGHRCCCLALTVLLAGGCSGENTPAWQGYVEGEYVYVASPLGGRVEQLAVDKGNRVRAGDLLYRLESALEEARVAEAAGTLAQAESILRDMEKGRRPTEIAAIEARLARIQEEERLAERQLERQRQLLEHRGSSQEGYDLAASARIRASRQAEEIRAELATARLGGREDALAGAAAAVRAATAGLEQALWNLAQKVQHAPCDALVFDILHREGEWTGAGRPVTVLLPPLNRKIRFFVPESALAALQPGQTVQVQADGLAQPLPAVIRYISPQAEYTPPVIYSSQSRAKLVFLVEAAPAAELAELLKPGQPVDVQVPPERRK